jgi:acyl-CoA thioesterase I
MRSAVWVTDMPRIICKNAALMAGLALFSSCGSKDAPTAPSPGQIVARVVVLGDSLAVSPSNLQSFPTHLQAHLDRAGVDALVVNASGWGDTTADGLKRLDAALVEGTRVLVLALGANDGLDGVPIVLIERRLDEIITRAQTRNIRVLLCGMETPPIHGLNYSLEFHRIFPRLATARGTGLVPFMLAGVLVNADMTADGVHPNAAGAQRIAETIWPYLEPMVREASLGAAEGYGASFAGTLAMTASGAPSESSVVISAVSKCSPAPAGTPRAKSTGGRKNDAMSPTTDMTAPAANTRLSAWANCARPAASS